MKLNALVFGLLLFFSCEKRYVSPENPSPSSIDYLIFGHTGSFCLNCDAIYKIQNGRLLGASHQMIYYPDSVNLTPRSNALYDSVSFLTEKIPSRLLSGSTTSVNTVGSYFPDAGHTYIEVSENKKVYRWFIEAGNIPNDLSGFVKEVRDVMGKLN